MREFVGTPTDPDQRSELDTSTVSSRMQTNVHFEPQADIGEVAGKPFLQPAAFPIRSAREKGSRSKASSSQPSFTCGPAPCLSGPGERNPLTSSKNMKRHNPEDEPDPRQIVAELIAENLKGLDWEFRYEERGNIFQHVAEGRRS